MRECELLEKCLFFNGIVSSDSGIGVHFKKTYCRGYNSVCARFVVAKTLGRDKVPLNLYPDMLVHALRIIENEQSKCVC
ncbi:MAG: hypothetical protein HY810_02820 [Candidatus Omnitrophica bacterium]|nr:hypothetical protein [Candidatus Omnitrophota bacterium]